MHPEHALDLLMANLDVSVEEFHPDPATLESDASTRDDSGGGSLLGAGGSSQPVVRTAQVPDALRASMPSEGMDLVLEGEPIGLPDLAAIVGGEPAKMQAQVLVARLGRVHVLLAGRSGAPESLAALTRELLEDEDGEEDGAPDEAGGERDEDDDEHEDEDKDELEEGSHAKNMAGMPRRKGSRAESLDQLIEQYANSRSGYAGLVARLQAGSGDTASGSSSEAESSALLQSRKAAALVSLLRKLPILGGFRDKRKGAVVSIGSVWSSDSATLRPNGDRASGDLLQVREAHGNRGIASTPSAQNREDGAVTLIPRLPHSFDSSPGGGGQTRDGPADGPSSWMQPPDRLARLLAWSRVDEAVAGSEGRRQRDTFILEVLE